MGADRRNMSGIKIFNCDEMGHISKECDKPPRQIGSLNGNQNRNNGRGGDRGGFGSGPSRAQMSEEQARSNYRGRPEKFDPQYHLNRGQNNGHRGGYSNNGNRNVQSNMGDRSQDPRVQGRPQQPLALTQVPHNPAALVCLWEGCGSTLHTQKDCPEAKAYFARLPRAKLGVSARGDANYSASPADTRARDGDFYDWRAPRPYGYYERCVGLYGLN